MPEKPLDLPENAGEPFILVRPWVSRKFAGKPEWDSAPNVYICDFYETKALPEYAPHKWFAERAKDRGFDYANGNLEEVAIDISLRFPGVKVYMVDKNKTTVELFGITRVSQVEMQTGTRRLV